MDDRVTPNGRMATVACPDCDLLQFLPELPPGGKARCGRTVATRTLDPIGRPLALTMTALLSLIVANTTPLMRLSAEGRHASTTIVGGAYQMWLQGQELTALIVAFCALIAPAGYILCMLSVVVLTMIAAASFDPRLIWDADASKDG